MRHRLRYVTLACLLAGLGTGCKPGDQPPAAATATPAPALAASYAATHMKDYVSVPLTADLSAFDEQGRQMIALLVQASELTNGLYWQQSWGDRAALLARTTDPQTSALAELNFGPWDRLNNDTPFVEGVGARPPGAAFYPADMTKAEFEASTLADKTSWYTLLRRDDSGKLITVPYHVAYRADLEKIAALLRQAALLSEDAALANYLRIRADALLTDEFQTSDMAWMDMKSNPVDIVIGPI